MKHPNNKEAVALKQAAVDWTCSVGASLDYRSDKQKYRLLSAAVAYAESIKGRSKDESKEV